MNHHYSDIVDRIDETPRWWDEHAVPRYCDFHPDYLANIYADTAVLLRIECQGCGHPFLVALSTAGLQTGRTLASAVQADEIHYGDPPNYCCGVGATMNSIPREVVEFWRRERFDWLRVPALQRRIACDWADPEETAA